MPSDEHTRLLHRYFEHLNPPGLAKIAAGELDLSPWWHEECVIVNFEEWFITTPYHGHEGLRQWAQDTFGLIERGSITLGEVVELDDDILLASHAIHGRMPSTELPVEFELWAVYRFEGGLIKHARGFQDRDEAERAAREPA